jgi:hypothetical protein
MTQWPLTLPPPLTMSEWILLHNTTVRQADIYKIEVDMRHDISYTVTLRGGDRLSVREDQAGGKWLYLRTKEATEAGWEAEKQVRRDEEEA